MRNRSPYEILGVPRDATSDRIHRAYLLKVQEVHPDNYDEVRQRARWEQANAQLKEVNEAYELLKDGTRRANFDRGAATPVTSRTRGEPAVGMAWFVNLPASVQERILARTSGQGGDQFAIPLGGLGWNYFFLIFLSGWFLILRGVGNEAARWTAEDHQITFFGTLIVALLQGLNLCRIVKWHRSPLRPHLVITPLYVIKTGLDRVWYWPIWTVTSIRATHNYKNFTYNYTDLYLEFGADKHRFTISPEPAFAAFAGFLNLFGQRVRDAQVRGDVDYLRDQDDFGEYDATIVQPAPPAPTRRILAIFGITLTIYLAGYFFAWLTNKDKPERTTWGPASVLQAPAGWRSASVTRAVGPY